MNTMKKISLKVAKAVEKAGYSFSYEVNEYFTQYFPTYIEIWFWLWRKKICYIIPSEEGCCVIRQYRILRKFIKMSDPEDAIVEAIDYLVDNDLIK